MSPTTIRYTTGMEVRTLGHSVYRLQYHIVWVCKYRRRILNPGVCQYLTVYLTKLLRSIPGVELETVGFDGDHVHMIMIIPPKYSIADVMGQLKSQSASQLRKKFAWLSEVYWKENIVWSPGYFVSSVGIDEKIIKSYVEHQGRQDSGQLRMGVVMFSSTTGLPVGIYEYRNKNDLFYPCLFTCIN